VESFRRFLGKGALPTGLVILAVVLAGILIATRPKPQRATQPEPVIGVRTEEVVIQDMPIRLRHYGTVIPAQEVVLRPEISGMVIAQNVKLIPGGFVSQGEELVKIDPRDYEFALIQAKADYEDALFNLRQEQGRKLVAEREWQLLGDEIKTNASGKELALREAHIRRAQALLAASQSRVAAAELNLKRTVISAPFNALVQSESVDTGQLITPQTEIARLVGTDQVWVKVSLPLEQLRWIDLARAQQRGPKATVIQRLSQDVQVQREGHLFQLLGDIKPETSTASVLVVVDDPFDLAKAAAPMPLLIGAWVEVMIEGSLAEHAIKLPATAVREGDQVWVFGVDQRLEIRKVRPLLTLPEDEVLIAEGLAPGERVIISAISTPLPGMRLRDDTLAEPGQKEGKS